MHSFGRIFVTFTANADFSDTGLPEPPPARYVVITQVHTSLDDPKQIFFLEFTDDDDDLVLLFGSAIDRVFNTVAAIGKDGAGYFETSIANDLPEAVREEIAKIMRESGARMMQ